MVEPDIGIHGEGPKMTRLRNAMELMVDKVVKKIDQTTFVENLPQTIKSEKLVMYHNKLEQVMRIKLNAQVEDLLRGEEDYPAKLNGLDERARVTQQPSNHKAWRPLYENTVQDSMIARDLKVSLHHKDALEAMVKKIETEVEDLTTDLEAASRRMLENQAVLSNMEQQYDTLQQKLLSGANYGAGGR